MRRPRLTRDSEIARVRNALLREEFPRVQMFVLVSATGGSGFLASFIMFKMGIDGLALRYTLAMGVAYIAFLGLLWIWLRFRADDFLDAADPSAAVDAVDVLTIAEDAIDLVGAGGSFDGGGASASFDLASDTSSTLASAGEGIGDSIGDKLSVLGEADEAAIPIAVIVLIGAIIMSSLFIIYSAPLLFAEIIVDGLLSASLYRRLRGLESQHWIQTAIKRTIWPFVITTVVVCLAGWSMSSYAPGARNLGEVLRYSAPAPVEAQQ